MITLTLRLNLDLTWESSGPALANANGALFHRWLPNGKEDAISLAPPDAQQRLSVWFERCGYVDGAGGFIVFDYKRRDVDATVIPRQGRLDAGPLRGECTIRCTDEELTAVRSAKEGDAAYVAVGKRAVEFLQPKLSEFIDILRYRFGQYWLEPLHPWDSRRESLGHYCASLGLSWLGDADTWDRFRPTPMSATMIVSRNRDRDFDQLLTESDWRELQRTCNASGAGLHLALPLLGRVGELIDGGELRAAFLEAHSAAEVALAARMALAAGDSEELVKRRNEIKDKLSVAARIWAVLALDTSFPKESLEAAIAAVEIRNKIAHEGMHVDKTHLPALMALVKAAAAIAQVSIKLPALPTGNSLGPPDGTRIEIGMDLG